MKRRRYLAGVGVSLASLSGCLDLAMPSHAVVKTTPAPGSDPETTVRYASLRPAEQSIARAAVEEGVRYVCSDLSGPVRSLAERFSDANTGFLTHRGSVYAAYVAVRDAVYAHAASPPDGDPPCGPF